VSHSLVLCILSGPPKLKTTIFVHTAVKKSSCSDLLMHSTYPLQSHSSSHFDFTHTDSHTALYVQARRALEGHYAHYLGQKGPPMLSNLVYYSYENMNMVDWMHNCANLFKWVMKIIVGPYGDKNGSRSQKIKSVEAKQRRDLKENGIFPELWPDAPVYLNQFKTSLLRNLDPDAIACEGTTWCKRWWKACRKPVGTGEDSYMHVCRSFLHMMMVFYLLILFVCVGTGVRVLRKQILEWRKYLVDNPTSKLQIDTVWAYINNNVSSVCAVMVMVMSFITKSILRRLYAIALAPKFHCSGGSRQPRSENCLSSRDKWMQQGWRQLFQKVWSNMENIGKTHGSFTHIDDCTSWLCTNSTSCSETFGLGPTHFARPLYKRK